MKAPWVCIAPVCLWYGAVTANAEEILVGNDGSVTGKFDGGSNVVAIGFGLPQIAPEKRWQENGVLCTVWVTNGIRYTQTLVLTLLPAGSKAGARTTVLLVNIAGENTNSVYAEAAAELRLEAGGRAENLELATGFVWRVNAQGRCLLGALDIPAPGIKLASGETLRFSGNMPPAERGSLTLKIPLGPIKDQSEMDALTDLIFAEESGRLSRKRKNEAPAPTGARVLFAPGVRLIP